jgi:hypothetical protein
LHVNRYPELSSFSTAFADAYRGFMTEARVTGKQIAAKLDRNLGYVSERVNGKRALDTEDVDALAMLAGDGWTGRTLMIELARRARIATEGPGEVLPDNVTRLPQTGGALSAIDMLDDEGTVEYDGLKAADRGESLADSIPAVDEDPEPEDDPK